MNCGRLAAECLRLLESLAKGFDLAREAGEREVGLRGRIGRAERLQLSDTGGRGVERRSQRAGSRGKLLGESAQSNAGPDLAFGGAQRGLELDSRAFCGAGLDQACRVSAFGLELQERSRIRQTP